jgi:hypothetical protein
VVLLIAGFIFRKTLKNTLFYKKVHGIMKDLKEGFISIGSIKKKDGLFFIQ